MYKNGDKIIKQTPTRYFKAELYEVPDDEGVIESHVKLKMSKKPFAPEQFISLMMGVFEAYAEALLENNKPEDIYDTFNSAFGVFLSKLVPKDYIYSKDEAHKTYKEHVDATLGGEKNNELIESNKAAAYLLCADILVNEIGLSPDSANLILSRRLGTVKTADEEK